MTRTLRTPAFKKKVALEALKEDKTLGQIASQFGVHPIQVSQWKQELLVGCEAVFQDKRKRTKTEECGREALERKIGQLTIDIDYLKKKLGLTVEEKRLWIEPEHPDLSVLEQCLLLSLSRSSYYYRPRPLNEYDMLLMRLVDEMYTKYPFYGSRRITAELERAKYVVNRKRIQGIMQNLGLAGNQPGPQTSKSHPSHPKFPYLLRGVDIVRPLQAWSTDITYIRLPEGFVYLTAVIDWYSRLVLSSRLSNSLEGSFCLEALEEAIEIYGQPEIFNTDQGVQYTCQEFVEAILGRGIRFSMDGRGRALDNIFVERLWRSLKYEEVYLHDYQSVGEARSKIERYFAFYNKERPHQSLGYRTPYEVHFG
ncbi:MAG: IS3 family transposase [Nitrosotalea sp.]